MTKKETIEKFLASGAIAVAGVSRNPNKFGSGAYKELKKKGFNVFPVNPNIPEFQGDKCFASVDEIPGEVCALFTSVSPAQNEVMIKLLKRKDIKYLWLQPGSEFLGAEEFCKNAGIDVITGECIHMHAQPNGMHNVHKFFRTIFGKMPA